MVLRSSISSILIDSRKRSVESVLKRTVAHRAASTDSPNFHRLRTSTSANCVLKRPLAPVPNLTFMSTLLHRLVPYCDTQRRIAILTVVQNHFYSLSSSSELLKKATDSPTWLMIISPDIPE
jgi:hypothetical protein